MDKPQSDAAKKVAFATPSSGEQHQNPQQQVNADGASLGGHTVNTAVAASTAGPSIEGDAPPSNILSPALSFSSIGHSPVPAPSFEPSSQGLHFGKQPASPDDDGNRRNVLSIAALTTSSNTEQDDRHSKGDEKDEEKKEDEDEITEEEAQESAAAAAQAEDGAIEFDSEEYNAGPDFRSRDHDDTMTDAGYESDTATRASTSLASSVRDFVYENGRRYHRFREGRYNFPNDDIEQEREDMKHAMVKMLCQRLYFAPIGDAPGEILDIGTGTGIWAIEMGDLFENANVLGIDLSPHQPDWVPPNVRFTVDDVESPWLHPRNHFDYIHSRHTVMAIKDWPKLFHRSLEHLQPGGWMELQEIYHYPISANDSMPPEHPVARYWALINEGLTNLGIDFQAASNGRLANSMRDCGFTDVTERVLHVPLGTWPRNRVLKTVGLYWRTILLEGIQAIALGPLTRGCGWTVPEVELFLVEVRKAYMDNSCLMYMPLHIIYGQKPVGS